MTTIVNTPPTADDSSSSAVTLILGLVLLAVFVFFLVYYGPRLINAISSRSSGINVTVPDKVDINVNQPQ